MIKSAPKPGVKRFCTERGIDQPRPKSRKLVDYNRIAIINSAALVQQTNFLEFGSILGARFPHRVKM